MRKLAFHVVREPYENRFEYPHLWRHTDPITNFEHVTGVLRPHISYPTNRLGTPVYIPCE